MKQLTYRLVDVFSKKPLSGNSLTVFFDCKDLNAKTMQKITQEMRQFESIFLSPTDVSNQFSARIFTMEEELAFAGHPILGAASTLHEQTNSEDIEHKWVFELVEKRINVTTVKKKGYYLATMEQGTPIFGSLLPISKATKLLDSFNLSNDDLYPNLPLQVVSTGLPYLIIPLQKGIEKATVRSSELEEMLAAIGAKFCYLLDIPNLEGRTWDNLGHTEDIATGSAAGPAAAYLIEQKLMKPNTEILLQQGRFLNRPSKLFVSVSRKFDSITSIQVSGEVCMVASGSFDIFPNQKF